MDESLIPLKAIIFDAGDILLQFNKEKASIAQNKLFSFLKNQNIPESEFDDQLILGRSKVFFASLSPARDRVTPPLHEKLP